jgi:two-component system, LytTR family, response regulator
MSGTPNGRARALIVDDEPAARRGLQRVISAMPRIGGTAQCANGSEAVALIAREVFDIVILDVQMPGLDGIEVVRRVGVPAMPPVVFVTAHDAYALSAFELAAVDYVLKPYTDGRLRAAVNRALDRGAERNAAQLLERLLATLNESSAGRPSAPLPDSSTVAAPPAGGFLERILATAGRRGVVIPVAEIMFVQADDYCAIIVTASARAVIRESLAELEALLDPAHFIRVHRNALVRIDAVRSVQRSARGAQLVLVNGAVVAVSRSRLRRLVESLGGAR